MHYLKDELYSLIKSDSEIFNFLQDSALDGLWYWDLEKMEEEWMNERFWHTLGYDPKKMPHKASAWQDLIFAEDLEVAFLNAQKHFEDPNHPYDQIVRYKHKEGHTVWIRCRGLAIRDSNGKPTRMLGAHTDVTELKTNEEELMKVLEITKDQNERLMNFAHIVSHNLRSHSGNFELLLDILEAEYPNVKGSEVLKHLTSASKNLKDTIFHLNEVVSINNTTTEVLSPIDLKGSIENVIDSLEFMAKNSNVELENLVNESVTVMGVQAYVDSILHNLISNGIKYRDQSKESFLKISYATEDSYVHLFIEDNGLGMDLKRYGDKLFGMYKTFHEHENARGIGLFITKNQIQAMGGNIEVKSKPEQGTKFKVTFRNEKS